MYTDVPIPKPVLALTYIAVQPTKTAALMPASVPIPTLIPTNTLKPVQIATSTPATLTKTFVPGQQSTILAVVGNLWTQPNGKVIRNFLTGTAFTITGRSSDNKWLYGRTGKTTIGWIRASKVVAFDINSLPILPQVAQP